MPKIIYKKIKTAELKNFYDFFKHSIRSQFPEYSAKTAEFFIKNQYSLKNLTKQLKAKESAIFAAFNKNECIAFFLVDAWPGGICFGAWIAVDKNFQKLGVASKLIKMCEIEAKTKGFHKIHLWSDKRNLEFYKNRGFIVVGEIPESLYGSNDYLLYKTLQKPVEDKFLKSTKI